MPSKQNTVEPWPWAETSPEVHEFIAFDEPRYYVWRDDYPWSASVPIAVVIYGVYRDYVTYRAKFFYQDRAELKNRTGWPEEVYDALYRRATLEEFTAAVL